MGFLGLELEQAAPRYRMRRFSAFLIDLVLVVGIWYIFYQAIGKPDFMSVKVAMDAMGALPAESQADAFTEVFAKFNEAFQYGLILWFIYEAFTTVVFRGSTPGKLIMGLQIIPMNPDRNLFLNILLLLVRSFVKMLFLYILQAIPFIICALAVFANSDRSGFDFFVKTRVSERSETRRQSL